MSKKSNAPLQIQLPALPAQQELLRAKQKIVMFIGGLGSGKTRAAVYKALQLGFLNAPCNGLFVEPSYTLVRDVALESFRTVLGELGIPFRIHLTNYVIRVADAFDILLRSGEEAERIIGVNAAWGIIDEPGKQSEEVGTNVLARIRDPKAKLRQLVLSGTPEGFNWFYDWSQMNDVFVVRAKTTDNPFLDADYVTTLSQRMTEEEIAAYINGEFVRFEGGWYHVKPRVLPYELVDDVKVFRKPEMTSGQLVIGVDTGGGLLKDRTAIVVVDKRDKGVVASWCSNSATVDTAADLVAKLWVKYTRREETPFAGFVQDIPPMVPTVLVEVNGIGLPMWQAIAITRRISAQQIKTTEASRYAGLLEAKKAVEAGIVEGPEELAEEADKLVVENGKFIGPKDLSMALGFCLKYILDSPYKPPINYAEKKFSMNLRRPGRGSY